MLAIVFAATPVFAGITQVPEIDGGSLSTGLGVISGAVLILRARMRRK
jgi:hypothetical protein